MHSLQARPWLSTTGLPLSGAMLCQCNPFDGLLRHECLLIPVRRILSAVETLDGQPGVTFLRAIDSTNTQVKLRFQTAA